MTTAKSDRFTSDEPEVVRILCKRLRKGDRILLDGTEIPATIHRAFPGRPTGMSVQLMAGGEYLALPGGDPIRVVDMAEDDSRRPYVLGSKRWAVEPAVAADFDGLS